MLKMRLEAQSRRRRAMHTAMPSGGAAGDDHVKHQSNTSETALARMARGEMFDEEECLTDDEQLDVLPGYPYSRHVTGRPDRRHRMPLCHVTPCCLLELLHVVASMVILCADSF